MYLLALCCSLRRSRHDFLLADEWILRSSRLLQLCLLSFAIPELIRALLIRCSLALSFGLSCDILSLREAGDHCLRLITEALQLQIRL